MSTNGHTLDCTCDECQRKFRITDPKPRFYHHGFNTGSGFTHFVMDREHGQPFAYRRTKQAAENYASKLNCETAATQQLWNRRES